MKQEIKEFYKVLLSLPLESTAADKRKRGRDFEKLLNLILDENDLSPELNFRPKGEEIDGSFLLNDKVYLLEAKWHKDSLPASAIYAFKGKVDGKLIGTIGIFVSMSGYSDDAVDALSLGKTLNVILFDRNDIEASLSRSFREVLLTKLRKAAEIGLIYYPISSTQITYEKETSTTEAIETAKVASKGILSIICEGRTDAIILHELIRKIAREEVIKNFSFVTIEANGKYQAPKLGEEFTRLNGSTDKLLFVVDGDQQVGETEELFTNRGFSLNSVVIPNPSIETWLGLREDQSLTEFYEEHKIKRFDEESLKKLVQKINLKELKENNEEFRKFTDLIEGKLKE